MSFPEIESENYYSELLMKKEIKDYKTTKVTQSKIQLEPQQKMLSNYISPITPYNGLLVFHETGVGKTGTAIAIAERFKDYLKKADTRILVLVKNTTIEKNFKNELMKEFFTGSSYISPTERQRYIKASNAAKANFFKVFSRRLGKLYEFITYGTFINRTIGRLKTKGKREIQGTKINSLNNRIIIIDEAHNLTGNDGYLAVRTMLNKSYNTRVVLLSATPAFDNVGEITEILNMILPKDQQLPDRINKKKTKAFLIRPVFGIPKKLKTGQLNIPLKIPILTTTGMSLIKEYSKGKVSYLRVNPATFPKRIDKGTALTSKKGSITVVKCEMSDYQWKTVLKAIRKDKTGKSSESPNSRASISTRSKTTRSVAFKNTSDASTFVSPIKDTKGVGLYGSKGFTETFGKKFNKVKSKLQGGSLKKYSCKIYRLIENVRISQGPVFVFSGFVSEGGVTVVSKLLELNGFANYGSSSSKPKYAVLSGETDPAKRERIRQKFNSPTNKYGKDIKVLLATPVFSEGVTLKNVRQIHILEPSWNMSRMEQVVGRGVRNQSHVDLPPRERKVKVFRYAAVAPKGTGIDTIDIIKYKVAEEKDRSIKKMEDLLKVTAFDCALNKSRNTLAKKHDETRKCGYKKCRYSCQSGIIPLETDTSTWIHSLTKPEKEKIKQEIKALFKNDIVWKLSQIKEALSDTEPMAINIALDEIITLKEPVFDSFDREGTIVYRGSSYVFQPEDLAIDASVFKRNFGPMEIPKGNLKIFLRKLDILTPKPKKKTKAKTTRTPASVSKNKGKKLEEISEADAQYNQQVVKNPVYGTYYNRVGKQDGKFRIVDNRSQKTQSDQRKKVSGQACSSTPVTKLEDIAVNVLNLDLQVLAKKSRPNLCKLVESEMKKKGLVMK